jgi:NodT family efflux transporter outer membrane factor (OMF) lipoprotein
VNSYRLIMLPIVSCLLASCAIGPSYKPVDIPRPDAFKEVWQPATPLDSEPKGPWWQMYGDATLNDLEEKAIQANQTIRIAEAQYGAAAATVQAAHWALLPSLTFSAGSTENLSLSNSSGGGPQTIATSTTDKVSGSAGWELDFWGQLRRGLQQTNRLAEGSAKDLLAAQLSVTANLAQAYMQLRAIDVQQDLLQRAISAYERSLTITRNRYAAGVSQRTDVTQAESQLASTQAQQAELGVQRPILEHAIAVLTGQAPEDFSLAKDSALPTLPGVPTVLPATLLERRPDVAAAERRVAAANAAIGVAQSAYFPAVSITGTTGYQSNSFHNLASLPNKVWSFGPSVAYSLFDQGTRKLRLGTAKAGYRQAVATYRQAVLSALQDAEDQLVTLHGLSIEEEAAGRAARAAKETLVATENQYRAGTVSYLNVVIAESTSLTTDSTLINVQSRRLQAHVGLLRAMGGSANP